MNNARRHISFAKPGRSLRFRCFVSLLMGASAFLAAITAMAKDFVLFDAATTGVVADRDASKVVGVAVYIASALRHPNIVGAHWHQSGEQPTTGRFDSENLQNGLLDVCDTPYPETIAGVREVGYGLYELRSQANPVAICAAEIPTRPTGDDWPPVIGAWFWGDATLEPEGYKPFLDAVADHSPYTLLTTSLRTPKGEITDQPIREHIGKAVRYANSLGLRVAFDLDVRLARRAFQNRYPDELQEELVFKTVELPTNGAVDVTFAGQDLSDHMTGGTTPYLCLTSQLVRVYAFARGADGMDPDTVTELTAR